jgi:hypothetical protein
MLLSNDIPSCSQSRAILSNGHCSTQALALAGLRKGIGEQVPHSAAGSKAVFSGTLTGPVDCQNRMLDSSWFDWSQAQIPQLP